MSARILIVDDDTGYASALARQFSRTGHEVVTLNSAAAARSQVQSFSPDVVVLDQRLPDASALDFMEELKPLVKDAVFVIVTAYPDVEVAVSSMQRGAFDYFAKGTDLSESSVRLERAIGHAELKRRVIEAEQTQNNQANDLLIGE